MAAVMVEHVVAGAYDAAGVPIEQVYTKVGTRYAVYRTRDQVMIHFADDDGEGVNQRTALKPVEGLRSEVNGLICALREGPAPAAQAQAVQYERRVAFALTAALRGDSQQALVELTAVRNDLVEDRASEIRTRHLFYAAYATAGVIVLARIIASSTFANFFGAFDPGVSPAYWTGAAVGAIGAFFSIALQIRSRQVPVDLQFWDNLTDAVLRIFVGATSAVMLVALLHSQMVEVRVAEVTAANSIHMLVVASFAAGFAERLVADFLGGLSLAARKRQPEPPVSNSQSGADERSVATGGGGGAGGGAPPPPPPPPPPGGGGAATPLVALPVDSEELAEPDDEEDEAPGDAAPQPPPTGEAVG